MVNKRSMSAPCRRVFPARENASTKSWLVLVFRPISWESGTSFLHQSQSQMKQNQCNAGLLSTLLKRTLSSGIYRGNLLTCFFFVPNKGKPIEASKEMTVKQYGELKTTDFVPGTEVNCSRRWDYRISKPVHHPWDCGLMLLRNPVIL